MTAPLPSAAPAATATDPVVDPGTGAPVGDPAVETDPGARQLNEHGYPDSTPLAEMDIAEQAAYWKHQSRKHEARARANTGALSAEDAQALRDQVTQLQAAALTDEQRAQAAEVATAVEAARTAEREALLPMLHDAQLRGYASTVIKGDRLEGFVSTVNVAKFLNDAGQVDGEKVVAHVTAQYGAPGETETPAGTPPSPPATYPDLGQGKTGAGINKTPARDAGIAEAARRFANSAGK
ncbi:hypothetical protein OG563_26475 [Nocardia vinacea]|uniref:Scaffolding protein n=1 Tax=Nocardia vinacea TaxID=96468 RepID=A0ABZ1YIC1_9NOCA|nr:hypothetical protein [Nocardia vinacea]